MQRIVKKLDLTKIIIPKRKRVAAYARVSSGKEAMLHSLSAQVSYYSELIQNNPKWQYVGVYADEAITGTKDSRAEFQKMIEDCKSGKIEMIITKSISRFARNTVTMLQIVRELKGMGVDVFFENEKIHSTSEDGELMLTILSSFAQEESLSISENCKWRIRNKFKQGIPTVHPILGYKYVDENLVIIPKEAKIVRMIFDDYLNGMGLNAIVKKLNKLRLPTKTSQKNWQEGMIHKILRNEKYTGDLLLQKNYVKDHISKKLCLNKGELPKYYVENNHEAIIDKNTFEKVQKEIERRNNKIKNSKKFSDNYIFTKKITCGKCGKHYRRKIANAGTKYAKPVWICDTFNRFGKTVCPSRQIPEEILLSLVPDNFKEIQVADDNKLVIILSDGTVTEKNWQHKSRSESWTDEMRKIASERRRAS